MTAVDNTVQKKLKFKITSKGIRDASDKKSCKNLVKVIVSNGPRVTGAGNENSATNISVKPCVPKSSNKRRPEITLDAQRGKRQKMEHGVKQQCCNILKTLIMHRVGCYFNEPVDPVKLKIPDYFSIITEPMDLGTIKSKLEDNVNYGAEEFAADVRLTFSNAMLYNPPGNCIHRFAKELDGIFNKRWKTMEAKLKSESRNVEHGNVLDEMEKNGQNSKQAIKKNGLDTKKIGLNKVALRVNLVTKRPMSLGEKQKLKLEFLDITSRKITENLRIVFQKFGLTDLNEERLNFYFDAVEDETLWKLKRAVKCFLDARVGKVEPAKMGQSEHLVQSKAVQKAKCSSCGSLACHCRLKIASVQASSSDITSERSSKLDRCGDSKLDGEVKYPLASNNRKLGPDFDGLGVVLFEESSPHLSTPVTTAVSSEVGWMAFNVQMSPKKALRAAMLKKRFADTIFRATQRTLLDHGEKSDPVRMQQERERMERQQLEEKTRFEAEVKAVEAASRMRREREREAARMALQKMEKTVEINEDQEILKYLEMLIWDSPSDFFDGLGSEASLGAIQGSRQSGNFLERLGLYMKDDYTEEDEDEILSGEEGEILS